jgi:Ca2+-transporting ATPase
MQTQIGRIAEQVSAEPSIVTPVQRKLSKLAGYLGIAGIAIAAGIMVAGIVRRMSLLDVFFLGVAAAVSFIPEGLPAVVTVVLALGVQRMARNYAVIRKLPAVETLGSATVICTDKTGTLTRNQMTVRAAYTPDHSFTVTGEGYAPQGEFFEGGHKVDRRAYPDLNGLLTALVLASDARLLLLEDGKGTWSISGDPTEGSLVVAAEKLGLKRHDLEEIQPRIDEVPFDSNKRYMATLHRLPDGRKVAYVKGAVERITGMCSTYWQDGRVNKLSDEALAAFMEQNTRMASAAMRVLSVAFKEFPPDTEDIEPADVESGLTFLGAVGMIDPPREGAALAIKAARDAGIRVIMITGDHPDTARAIADSLGLLNRGGQVVEGKYLNSMTDDGLNAAIRVIAVVARAEPEHKIRIIRALKSHGQIVAMTGDGVNDAPALKMADIGIAMGITGTDVAKEASDMILLDDNFSTIVCAIEEGRNIFANIRRVTLYLLSTNSGEILVYLSGILMGLPIPLLPVQILWVNLVTDGFNTVPLAFEPGEPDVLKRPPRRPDSPIIDRGMAFRIAFMAAFMFAGTIGLYIWGLNNLSLAAARTLAFVTIALFQIFNVFNVRSERYSIARVGFLSNPYVLLGAGVSVLAQIAAVQAGFFQNIFSTVPLTFTQWLLCTGVASSILWAEEVRKLVAGRR